MRDTQPKPRTPRPKRVEPKSTQAKPRGGTLGSTRRPANDARGSILAAAERLFYEQGTRAVGVDAVAEAAGVTKRTLYYHFASKEDLVAAYLNARDTAALINLDAIETTRGPLPGDRILSAFDFLESWFATPGYRGCPFNNAVAEQGASETVMAIAQRHKAAVRTWFEQRAKEAGARHADALSAQLLLLLDGALNGAAVFGSADAAVVARTIADGTAGGRGRRPGKKAGK